MPKKSELITAIGGLETDITALEGTFSADSDEWDSDAASKLVAMREDYDLKKDQLAAIRGAESIFKKTVNDQIGQENALGSTEVASDLAGFLMDTLKGNLVNLGNDEIELPFNAFFDEILSSPLLTMGDTVLLRPATSSVPDLPRNRATGIGYVDVAFDQPTSLLDVIPKQQTDDSKITYNEFLTHNASASGDNADGTANNTRVKAALVAEGGAVIEANYALVPKTVNMKEYGLHTVVTRQAARDVVRLRTELASALRADIRQAMDQVIYDAIKANGTTIVEAAAEGKADQLIEAVDKAADDTYTMTQVYFMKGSAWSAMKRESNLKTVATDLSGFFNGRGRQIDGVPVGISAIMPATVAIGGNFTRRFIELFVRSNPTMAIGTIDKDFLKRQTRLMITMEAVLADKLDDVRGRFKNDPVNTGGWFA